MTPEEAAAAEVVRRLWDLIDARDWEGARQVLAEDFVAEWPHTGERIRGRDDFIELNRAYPEGWSIQVIRVLASDDVAVSEVRVPHAELGTSFVASFFDVRDRLIRRATEYWVDERSQEPPAWRARWVERF